MTPGALIQRDSKPYNNSGNMKPNSYYVVVMGTHIVVEGIPKDAWARNRFKPITNLITPCQPQTRK